MKFFYCTLLYCWTLGIIWPPAGFGQTLSESFGAQPTTFRITSDTLDFSPSFQQIVKRGHSGWNTYVDNDGGWAYGYGYESLHLEFQTSRKLLTQDRFNQPYRKRWFLEVELFGPNGEQLSRQELKADFLREVSNEKRTIFTYSLDLKNIPLVLLDQAERINLLRLNFYKRSQP